MDRGIGVLGWVVWGIFKVLYFGAFIRHRAVLIQGEGFKALASMRLRSLLTGRLLNQQKLRPCLVPRHRHVAHKHRPLLPGSWA